ncbi:MAG: DUF4349 domain-containing protein [Oscillospiraceae bacterium]
MKIKFLALLFATALILSACGSSSKDSVMNDEFSPSMSSSSASIGELVFDSNTETPSDKVTIENNSNNGESEITQEEKLDYNRKIIKNSMISLETKEFDNAVVDIVKMIEGMGGYVQNQTIDGISIHDYGNYNERRATVIARIPAKSFEDATATLGEKYNITQKSDYIDDITDSYYDVKAHMESLQAQEKQLLLLLEKAVKLENVIEIQKALAECRYQIDSLMGQIKRMDSQIAFSTLNLEILEVIEYKEINAAPKTFGEEIAQSFKTSGEHISSMCSRTLLFVIEYLPVLLIQFAIWGGIIFIIVWVITKVSRKIKPGKNYQSTYEQKPFSYEDAYKKPQEINQNKDEKTEITEKTDEKYKK